MIQSRIYAPTLEHHREALALVGRFRAKKAVTPIAATAIIMLAYWWWKSGFALPFVFDWFDLAFLVVVNAGIQTYSHFSRRDEAKMKVELRELDTDNHGPQYYRASLKGLEWWWFGIGEQIEWSQFDRYKVTDELLIVANARTGGYWALPRADLGPDLTSALVDILREAGAKEVVRRPRGPLINQPT
jgi:hypothetical protein